MSSCVRVGVISVHSLSANFQKVSAILTDKAVDVLILTKTRLKKSQKSSDLSVPGYSLYRKDRPSNTQHGGVAIIARTSLKAREITIAKSEKHRQVRVPLETIWLELKPKEGASIIVCSVYRPAVGRISDISAHIGTLQYQYSCVRRQFPGKATVMAGDININLLQESAGRGRFNSFLSDNCLKQWIDRPTYHTGSLLDALVTTEEALVGEWRVAACSFSTHSLILAQVVSSETCDQSPQLATARRNSRTLRSKVLAFIGFSRRLKRS